MPASKESALGFLCTSLGDACLPQRDPPARKMSPHDKEEDQIEDPGCHNETLRPKLAPRMRRLRGFVWRAKMGAASPENKDIIYVTQFAHRLIPCVCFKRGRLVLTLPHLNFKEASRQVGQPARLPRLLSLSTSVPAVRTESHFRKIARGWIVLFPQAVTSIDNLSGEAERYTDIRMTFWGHAS
ncbi:hypothetical protein SprV_0501941600 [Sparganum proliferum]